jgi:hypothetical protein
VRARFPSTDRDLHHASAQHDVRRERGIDEFVRRLVGRVERQLDRLLVARVPMTSFMKPIISRDLARKVS